MASVFILFIEADIHVFRTLERLITFLKNSEDDELSEGEIKVLISDKVLDTEYASYSWDEYQVN